MKNDLTGPLPLGELESLALPYESYQLALTSGQVSALVAEAQTLSGTALDPAVLTDEGAYLLRNGDYWAPSGRVIFDAQQFYLPVEAIDPFGNHAYVEWDEFSLLVKKTRDALGNATVATNDYRVLAPKQIQDPNLNRVQVAFDALGMVVATAVLGKEGSTEGDTLNDPTTRIEYDLLAFQEERGPALVHSFAREQHGVSNLRWQETYTYSDGFGRVVQTKVQAEPGEVPGIAEPVSERWVGTGRTVFNNKGNPVKQYEPFFSATHEFEDEEEIVETGVTPILRYDSLDRLVQTDLPDGTFTKIEFDCWRQEEWDQNDTVLESAWYVKWQSPDPDGAAPTDPHERAAWQSAQHAETPTVTHLDTLGRPFLSVAHNKTGTGVNRVDAFYRTRTQLDIEGNTLAIYDARQHSTSLGNDSLNGSGVYANIRQTFDVLGRRLKVSSSDAGVRLSVQDVANKPLRGWDSRGHVMRGRYDALQRPTHSFVRKGTTETLVQRMIYGEALDPSGPSENPASPSAAQLLNLRGQVHLVYDGAGVVKAEEHDFKGNLLRARRRLTKGYEETPDWSVLVELTSPSSIEDAAEALLEAETFETETEHDALNRVTLSKTPDGSETRPVYNEANLLEQMRVKVRGGSERIVVGNLDYNARGQRVLCDHANPTTGATSHSIEYTYDEKTFRLTRLVTTRTSDGVTLQDLRYFFDAVGNITEVQDRADAQEASRGLIFSGTDPVSGDGKYEYDALYRLTRAEGREHPGQQPADGEPTLGSVPHANDLSALERYTEEYEYDSVGNIESLAHASHSTNWTRRYSYAEDSNRLLATSLPGDLPNQLSATYAYNEHGSMLSMPHLQEMDWDHAERLQHTLKSSGSGQHTYFTYDASGERVRKVYEHNGIVEERIYLGGFEIYRKWEAAVGGTLKLERETLHTMDDQRRVAMVETKTWDTIAITNPAELWRFQLGNHLDSASLELDESAGVLTYEEYHPYGSTAFHTAKSGAEVSTKRYRYTGKERDEETGLYYHGARYYASWLGRWTAADPAGLVDGLNLYRYSRDNPISFSDPGGTESRGAGGAPHSEDEYQGQRGASSAGAASQQEELLRAAGRQYGKVQARINSLTVEINELHRSLSSRTATRLWDIEHYFAASGDWSPIQERQNELQALIEAGLAEQAGDGFLQATGYLDAVESGLITSEQDQEKFLQAASQALQSAETSWRIWRSVELLTSLIPGGRGVGSLFAKAPVTGSVALKALQAATRNVEGKWLNTGETMSKRAAEFQKAVTGVEAGTSFLRRGVKFDGLDKSGKVLLDAKGPGLKNFVKKGTNEFYDWFHGDKPLIQQAKRQVQAADGLKVEWVFAEEEALRAVKKLVEDAGISEILFRLKGF